MPRGPIKNRDGNVTFRYGNAKCLFKSVHIRPYDIGNCRGQDRHSFSMLTRIPSQDFLSEKNMELNLPLIYAAIMNTYKQIWVAKTGADVDVLANTRQRVVEITR